MAALGSQKIFCRHAFPGGVPGRRVEVLQEGPERTQEVLKRTPRGPKRSGRDSRTPPKPPSRPQRGLEGSINVEKTIRIQSLHRFGRLSRVFFL